MSTDVGTTGWVRQLYGDGVGDDDPAETYHEASRLDPHVLVTDVRGAHLLAVDERWRATAARSVKRYTSAPRVPLPPALSLRLPLADALRARRSGRSFARTPLTLAHVTTLLAAAYGVVEGRRGLLVRTAPSAGGLYPLELYVAATRVEALDPGVYHFDPHRGDGLDRLRAGLAASDLEPLTVYPALFTDAALVVFVTAVFWRTRFKYGQRGYRFALLEAGHAAQCLLLAAAALELAAVPVGGFYDRRVDALLGVDGVDEAALYAISVGARAEA